jgi:hypothetical protein
MLGLNHDEVDISPVKDPHRPGVRLKNGYLLGFEHHFTVHLSLLSFSEDLFFGHRARGNGLVLDAVEKAQHPFSGILLFGGDHKPGADTNNR